MAGLFVSAIDGHKLNCSNCVSFCGANRSGINVKLNRTRDAHTWRADIFDCKSWRSEWKKAKRHRTCVNRIGRYGPLTRKGAAPLFQASHLLVCCTNWKEMPLCNLPLDTPSKVGYNCKHKDVDREEYTSSVVGQRVGRRSLRARSNRRSGMVPRVARAKSLESSPSRSRHRYQGREYHRRRRGVCAETIVLAK